MKLTVIIVSYNVKSYLSQCLDSLRRATQGLEAEICVIDNHSKDLTVEMLRRDFPDVRLIASNSNRGFARANNIAISQTESEYVLLLNPDTFVGENTIKDCLRFMDEHEKAGGLGVCMLKCDGQKAMESRRGLPTPMTSLYKMCGLCSKYPDNPRFGKYYMGNMPWDKPGKIEVVSGAFFMIRRKALDRAGVLDEDFFMYGEDIDLSYRLLKCGFENWYYPSRILHYKGESTKKSSFRYVHVFYEAMLIFFQKHYEHKSFWLSIPIKTAIYLKAFLALISISYSQIRKILGFRQYRRSASPYYIITGTDEALAKCRDIMQQNGLSAQYLPKEDVVNSNFIDGVGNTVGNKGKVYVVFDTASYKYETILDIFSKNTNPDVMIGTYIPQDGIIITDKEIIS